VQRFCGLFTKSERRLGAPLSSRVYRVIWTALLIEERFPDVIEQRRFFLSVQFPTMIATICRVHHFNVELIRQGHQ
jgi:hypothetical protein